VTVILTGGTGFLGSSIHSKLIENQVDIIQISRLINKASSKNIYINAIDGDTDYGLKKYKFDVVIHCAARAHVMNDRCNNKLAEYRKVNTDGTLNLARQAVMAGAKRFIFISSIKVNGESTSGRSSYSSTDEPAPQDPYGISKAEAEVGLLQIAKETGLEVVIIRPTLVYGDGVKGNFFNLLKLASSGLPLPFGFIYNARSMVFLDNLVDLIVTCIDHKKAPSKIFLASDGDDISLSRLIRLIRGAMGKPTLLLPVPAILFRLLGILTGKSAVINRLVGDLKVDISDARLCLDWQPPYSVEYGIKATVDDFMKRTKFEKIK
jgi:UDP-glucose 4-epimerase